MRERKRERRRSGWGSSEKKKMEKRVGVGFLALWGFLLPGLRLLSFFLLPGLFF